MQFSGTGAAESEQRQAIGVLLRPAELTVEQLWTRYFSLGGGADAMELEGFLAGLISLPALERDVLAQALNERLDELDWPRRVPYSHAVRTIAPDSAPLAALVTLMSKAHLAAPEQLPAVAAEAAGALGVGLVPYLVDYEQRHLVPLPTADRPAGQPLRVDSTLAGRAFQLVRTLPFESETEPRLWVPLLDGVERLGVLEIRVASGQDLYDRGLRNQCRWLSSLLGHLLTSWAEYGDALHTARLREPRSAAAELLWSLLPPLTAGVDGFVLAGMLEPSERVAGDAFDYALSQTTVSLAIFDAMGHDFDAALLAAGALAAYRAARRTGPGVNRQARAIDETIAHRFSNAFCTGVVAELDLRTGRLRYLSAGHPAPLVYRRGKVVRSLDAGRRLPFGFDNAEAKVAEERLQPGDWLVLYTDGITEARAADGTFFGQDRLVDFLIREAAAGHPPPETVRRLTQAVLAHQHGVLRDDASILLASWNHHPMPGPDGDIRGT